MRPTSVKVSAAGNSAWVPINEIQAMFGIGIGVSLTSGANLTYKVQHTFDDPLGRRTVGLTRAGTVATVVDTAHGLSVSDSIIVTGSGSANLDGTYDIASIVDANTYTYTVANTGITTASDNTYVVSFRVWDHVSLTGLTARNDGNYAFPIQAVRLRLTAYVSGTAEMVVLQAIGR